MTFLLLLLIILTVSSLKFAPAGTFAPDALAPSRTRYWKGICTVLILLSHYTGYISPADGDALYLTAREWMGQSIVAPFFFFAGWGMMRRVSASGASYLKTLPRKALRIWLMCAVSVLLIWIAQTLRGREYEWDTVLLAFFGWVNLGNSTWFIFVMLIEYALFALAMIPAVWKPGAVSRILSALLLTGLTVGFILWMRSQELESYWYNTVLLFPFGCWAALARKPLRKLCAHSALTWSLSLLLALTAYAFFFRIRTESEAAEAGCFILLATVIALISLKAVPENPLLGFLGEHALGIYLFQRLGMIALYESGWTESIPYLGCILALAAACVLSLAWDAVQKRIPFLNGAKK